MTSGIHTITNLVNNKIYVGYASDIDGRLTTHLYELRNKKHPNSHLQSAFNKYGRDNFKFELLEECGEKLFCALEHYWCTILNTHNRRFGYNIRPTNPNDSCNKHSEESKKKLSIKARKRYKEGAINPMEGRNHTQETKDKISNFYGGKLIGENNPNFGKRWSKDKKEEQSKKLIEYSKNHREEIIQRAAFRKRKILKYDLKDNLLQEYDSLKTAAIDNNIPISTMWQICQMGRRRPKEFIFKCGR